MGQLSLSTQILTLIRVEGANRCETRGSTYILETVSSNGCRHVYRVLPFWVLERNRSHVLISRQFEKMVKVKTDVNQAQRQFTISRFVNAILYLLVLLCYSTWSTHVSSR